MKRRRAARAVAAAPWARRRPAPIGSLRREANVWTPFASVGRERRPIGGLVVFESEVEKGERVRIRSPSRYRG